VGHRAFDVRYSGANANVAGLPRRTKNRRYAHHVEPMFGKRPVKA